MKRLTGEMDENVQFWEEDALRLGGSFAANLLKYFVIIIYKQEGYALSQQ